MKYQTLFSGVYIITLSPAEFAQRVVKVKGNQKYDAPMPKATSHISSIISSEKKKKK